ncbi:MAG: hypothetical protein RLZZ157_151 [Pseudomonadota bacterium]|jgi:hypothetical protein
MMDGIFITAIETSYGSLESPNWSFVSKRMNKGLYDDLVSELRAFGSIQETTDLNDDCSRCVYIESETDSFTLRLSLVGRFACIHDEYGHFLNEFSLKKLYLGEKVLGLLNTSNIMLLDEQHLRTTMLFGREQHSLYEILFSSDELIG